MNLLCHGKREEVTDPLPGPSRCRESRMMIDEAWGEDGDVGVDVGGESEEDGGNRGKQLLFRMYPILRSSFSFHLLRPGVGE